MTTTFSANMCEAIATDFVEGASSLQEQGIFYHFDDSEAWVREQTDSHVNFQTTPPIGTRYMRAASEDGGEVLVYKLPIPAFVGGVAFALACRGDIIPETASSQNIAGVCFALGRLTVKIPEGAISG